MKVWRRLIKMGAASFKGSVYILPYSEDHLEALHWLTGEVASLGGEAAFVKVGRIESLDDEKIKALFKAQRENEYTPIEAPLEALEVQLSSLEQQEDPKGLDKVKVTFQKMLKDYRVIQAIDFFHSPKGSGLQERLERFEERFKKLTAQPQVERPKLAGPKKKDDYQDRVWVTRKTPFVDRMASAWLIRRFIDPKARFEFLEKEKVIAEIPNAVSFDVPGGDFSHQQDRCTFEVLLETFSLRGKTLRKMAEVVHELDLKDGKFLNPQVSGVESILLGIRKTAADDRDALEEGIKVFERLYAALSK
ncbi:MAG: chromate resistance protein [Desulfobaccales bacterium]|nr:chromate resistance protein [Desulfobaccales bacterium]